MGAAVAGGSGSGGGGDADGRGGRSAAASPLEPPLAVSKWSSQHVAAWVASFGSDYSQFGAKIISLGVDGEAILDDFGARELSEIGVELTSQLKKILREVKKLAQK